MDSHGLHRPACGYELTGLTEPRYPECGEVFDPVYLQGMRRKYPGVIETSPRLKWAVFYVGLVLFVVVLLFLLKDAGRDEAQIGIATFIATVVVAMVIALRWLGQDHL